MGLSDAEAAAVFSDLQSRIGVRLFTVSVLDSAAGLARRAYTSHPVDYPVSGTKPMTPDAWSEHVIKGRKTFVANSPDGYAGLFPDHALIASLGCGSVANVPVITDDGTVVATVNLLDAAGYFTPARLAECVNAVAAVRDDLLAAVAAVRLT